MEGMKQIRYNICIYGKVIMKPLNSYHILIKMSKKKKKKKVTIIT
jgi:hypothetical protein